MTAAQMEKLALFVGELEEAEKRAGMFLLHPNEAATVVDREGNVLAEILLKGSTEHEIQVQI